MQLKKFKLYIVTIKTKFIMKKILQTVTMFLIPLCSVALHAEEKTYEIIVSNDWSNAQIDAPVVVSIAELGCDFNVKSAVVTMGGVEIPSQIDDLDGDNKADEIAFVVDMPVASARSAFITLSSVKEQKQYPSRVFAQMLISDKNGKHVPISSLTIPGTSNVYNQLHHHGPAFESELTAYRIYFDQKQTVDIYGKFNKGFEIKESQFYPTDEQLARGFGDDVLLVGGSCGLGALKGWDGTKATHIEPVATLTESILAYGPVRTIVDVVSNGWQYQGGVLKMTVRYIMYAGHRDCEVQVYFDRPLRDEIFSTGVININGSVSHSDNEGLIACWGTHWPVGDTVKYAKETVGLATCLPRDIILSEKPDRLNYLYQVGGEGLTGFKYHITFTSMKETYGYKTSGEWFEHVAEWKESLLNPLQIKYWR
jgi:hypothetical protein